MYFIAISILLPVVNLIFCKRFQRLDSTKKNYNSTTPRHEFQISSGYFLQGFLNYKLTSLFLEKKAIANTKKSWS
jgi:hypothetical protein